jgi:hypothetical protein
LWSGVDGLLFRFCPRADAAMELHRGRLEAHRRTVATLIKHKDVAKKFFMGYLFVDAFV